VEWHFQEEEDIARKRLDAQNTLDYITLLFGMRKGGWKNEQTKQTKHNNPKMDNTSQKEPTTKRPNGSTKDGELNMSAIETLAKRALETKGTDHMQAIQTLRKYMNLCPISEAISNINMITDVNILRILFEVGMRGELHRITVSRITMLNKEQQEARK